MGPSPRNVARLEAGPLARRVELQGVIQCSTPPCLLQVKQALLTIDLRGLLSRPRLDTRHYPHEVFVICVAVVPGLVGQAWHVCPW